MPPGFIGSDGKFLDIDWDFVGFSQFRQKIISQIGYDEIYDAVRDFRMSIEEKKELIEKYGFFNFLTHQDYGGFLPWESCLETANRIEKVIREWSFEDKDKKRGERLIEGMRLCFQEKKNLIFHDRWGCTDGNRPCSLHPHGISQEEFLENKKKYPVEYGQMVRREKVSI